MLSAPLLQPTFFLDFEHPRVADFVREQTCGASSDRERAARLFRAVRDGVRYDPYQIDLSRAGMTASATLERGASFCVPKAIVLAAALRSVGIPTRLGFVDVTNHLTTRRLVALLRTEVFAFHGYVEVHLGDKVLKAAPAFDASLCARFNVPPLEFDGTGDAMLQAYDDKGHRFLEYVRERGVFDDYPHEELIRVWREMYPHLMGGENG